MTPYEKALGDSAKEKLSQFSGRTGFRERWPSAASGKQRGEENKKQSKKPAVGDSQMKH